MPELYILPQNIRVTVEENAKLLDVLRDAGVFVDAPCGGNGICGKCNVIADGEVVQACRTAVFRDMTVTLPTATELRVLQHGKTDGIVAASAETGYFAAVDVGTTSVVCYLLDGRSGTELAKSSMLNPQAVFGADVISRIQAALRGDMEKLTKMIRVAVTSLIRAACADAGIQPLQISVVSLVGNPAMQQLFLGISPENLAAIPFAPVLTEARTVPCQEILSICPNGQLLIVPDISGYVGADTIGCLLATQFYRHSELTLLVDIGTNGEMVLGNKDRMIACATAAGPALEGANIRFGMRAAEGAIDHVWLEKGRIKCSVIGGGEAKGICGSGLVDAVAVGLKLGRINKRGRIQTEDHSLHLTDTVYLTQEDIRQVQMAKGAICAGIRLMAKQMGVEIGEIQRVQLAGAFGSFLNPENACRIGLLPEELLTKIEVVGNAAGSGAKMLALDQSLLSLAQELTRETEFLELASLGAFPKIFAGAMLFREEDLISQWQEKAKEMGFDVAATIDPQNLVTHKDVRAMCAEDKCGAYNKNWTCPPAVGTLEECREKMRKYRRGILLQSVGYMAKTIDSRCYRETEKRHIQNFNAFSDEIRREYPDALCLGAGGCRVCKQCAYPEPCRFPEKALSSMEGYGLFVTQVCRDAGVPYHYGDKTITYTACVLF